MVWQSLQWEPYPQAAEWLELDRHFGDAVVGAVQEEEGAKKSGAGVNIPFPMLLFLEPEISFCFPLFLPVCSYWDSAVWTAGDDGARACWAGAEGASITRCWLGERLRQVPGHVPCPSPVKDLLELLSPASKTQGSSRQTPGTAGRVLLLDYFLSFWFHAGSPLTLFSFLFLSF